MTLLEVWRMLEVPDWCSCPWSWMGCVLKVPLSLSFKFHEDLMHRSWEIMSSIYWLVVDTQTDRHTDRLKHFLIESTDPWVKSLFQWAIPNIIFCFLSISILELPLFIGVSRFFFQAIPQFLGNSKNSFVSMFNFETTVSVFLWSIPEFWAIPRIPLSAF